MINSSYRYIHKQIRRKMIGSKRSIEDSTLRYRLIMESLPLRKFLSYQWQTEIKIDR